MFGSYGSYSSMCAASQPMDITSRSLSAHDATCAFPSWPRRDSLSESDREERPSSYLSDDDLFLSDPFDDDTRSVSSAGSAGSPGIISPPHISDAELLLEMERERLALQREYVRCVISEKERRRSQAARKRKASSGSSKKSPKNKPSAMAPISEE
ncbi:hypothetical protein B0T10DRAFT_556750 [Thelonectria olida]|uniref:Uncharacterized protein n=1 Tax=Thelonectria olida TaxID=1576542 RepID=A0A9P8WEJ0_9HYPO|nr:hypothetical protein B0T10DRAFT_556750 [Thelonectria olida]